MIHIFQILILIDMEKSKMTDDDYITYCEDLEADNYIWSNPQLDVTEKIVEELVKRIVLKKMIDTEAQFRLLRCLCKWSWFPCTQEVYNPLEAIIDEIKHPVNLELAITIFANSGDKRYLKLYKKYSLHSNKHVRDVALSALQNLQ